MSRILVLVLLCLTPLLAQAQTLLVVGDSISAGYGLARIDQGWVSLLQRALQPRDIAVVNASISGDTTAGGLARIDELLQRVHPRWVLIELGGNDGLRGLTPAQMADNLTAMIGKARQAGAEVLLLGMRIPPNYGKRYAEMFQRVYGEVAGRQRVALVPFLLEGVGGHDSLMQADGIHPTAEGYRIVVENVLQSLLPVLNKPAAAKTGTKKKA